MKFRSSYSLIVIGFHSAPTYLGSLRQKAVPTLLYVASVADFLDTVLL